MAITTPFQTVFAVPMTCQSCISDISGSLHKLPGILKVDANLKDQLVSIEGTAPPSAILEAIQATGRDAILRGSGGSNAAAVCILETHSTGVKDHVRGLARMVQVAPSMTIVDLTIRGLTPGVYRATIRQAGDISRGVFSVGGVWEAGPGSAENGRGVFGLVTVGQDGRGGVFWDRPIQVWEMIGRSMVISRDLGGSAEKLQNDPDTLVGVVARSAGIWENDKTVCSCSGKTIWEERQEEVSKGML